MKRPIYFVGSHGAGKTSLARWVADAYKLRRLGEVARTELAFREVDLAALRLDVEAISDYQRAVFLGQVAAEEAMEPPYVSDRSFDNVAYLAHHGRGLAKLARSPEMAHYLKRVRGGVVFFVRPHDGRVLADGARPLADTERDSQMQIDGAVRLLLELWDIPHIPIPAASPKDRQAIVSAVLDLAGFRRSG